MPGPGDARARRHLHRSKHARNPVEWLLNLVAQLVAQSRHGTVDAGVTGKTMKIFLWLMAIFFVVTAVSQATSQQQSDCPVDGGTLEETQCNYNRAYQRMQTSKAMMEDAQRHMNGWCISFLAAGVRKGNWTERDANQAGGGAVTFDNACEVARRFGLREPN